MSIRHLLLSMMVVLTVLALGIGTREVLELRARDKTIDWLEHTNQVSGVAQTASGTLARERGLTAMALWQPDLANRALLEALAAVRAETDLQMRSLSDLAPSTAEFADEQTLFLQLKEMQALHIELQSYRDVADATLTGVARGPQMDPQRWIALVTRQIEFLHHLVSTSTSLDGAATTAQPLIKDALFTLSEYLGRERAVIAGAIARDEPLSAVHKRELEHFRANILHTWQRADSLLDRFDHTPMIEHAIDRFWTDLFVHYEDMRIAILDSDAQQRPYPVSALEWFDNATRGIDAVLGLSAALHTEIDLRAKRMRSQANTEFFATLAALLVVLGLFVLAIGSIQRRVLHPLANLESAARAISSGNLSVRLAPSRNDELGNLARSFDHMRQSLLEAEEQRETSMNEMRKLNTAIEQSVSSIIITDERGIIEYTNPQFTRSTGYTHEDVRGRHANILKSGHTPPAHYEGLWHTLEGGKAWKGELLNRRKDGELFWEAVSISPICDDTGKVIHFISIQHDISDRKRIEARLDFISSYDPLTRLPNRALLNLRFNEAREAARRTNSRIALLVLGVDHFKRLNDSLGHEVGDQLLCELATRLTHATREHDTVSRLSGSEFAIILSEMSDAQDVVGLVAELLEALKKPMYVDEHVLQPILRAGISMLPDDGETLDQLLTCASMALHQAERDRNEPFMFFTGALNAHAQAQLALESALRIAIATERLELHYQPKVDLRTGRIIAAEALARWRHPETMEYVQPERFIAISEESGLIHALGEWALLEACRQNKRWQDAGLPKIPVAVNLSALQLQQRALPDQISDVLSRTGLDADYLEIELTESAVMDSPEEAAVALHLLKSIGLRIAIDDFGTGYSSLAYLNRFPVDMLKIDRSFISSLESDPSAATIASSVIALAHRMGLRVIAEGVENEAQLHFLVRQSCDEIQGYYFSPPLPAHAFAELLRSQRSLETLARSA